MSATRPADILKQLEGAGPPDADLLARFVASRDASAFEELARRHGSLVLGVCRRVTGHPQDAEDAFQAVFLLLAQKAGGVRSAGLLGNWLYGVAYRVALRARRAARRRKAREVTMSNPPELTAPAANPASPDLLPILDAELAALPAHYRDAIVLCDLQGASRETAAAALGVPEGTVSSRLANGRKRLAARLARRGVALSVVGLPAALADVRAAYVASPNLIARTGRLAADFAAGGPAPHSLAHLLNEGSAMRNLLIVSVALVATAAGVVLAGRPSPEAPLNDPPKPPVVAEKTPDPPKPKEEPRAAPPKVVTFTTAPKMRWSLDLSIGSPRTVRWNATGTHIAVQGPESATATGGSPGPRATVFLVAVEGKGGAPLTCHPEESAGLVAVLPNGGGLITDLREYKLISGHHRLTVWGARPPAPPAAAVPGGRRPGPVDDLVATSTVELDPTETHEYAFAVDGKTYRTWVPHRDGSGAVTKIEVVEVETATGKLGKSLLKVEYGRYAPLAPNGKRFAVCDPDGTKVTVYDLDTGAKVSEYKFPPDEQVELPGGKKIDLPAETVDMRNPAMMLSPDGRRLIISRGIGRTTVLNTDTGEALPKLEGATLARTFPELSAFSGDGRLLAVRSWPYSVKATRVKGSDKEQLGWSGGEPVLAVWDTQTGQVLKTWKSADGVRFAFNPKKPVLAIFEPNGKSDTRLGFWDFTAEVEEKK